VTPSLTTFIGRRSKELGSFDLGGFIDEDAQSLAGTLQSVFEQHSISHFQRIGFDTHRHDGHTPFSKSWRQTERRALPARGAKRNLQKGWYTTEGLNNAHYWQ